MVKRKQNVPLLNVKAVGWTLGVGIVLIILLLCCWAGASTLLRAPFFTIEDVSIADGLGAMAIPEIGKLKGQNIFSVDLAAEEERIRSKYPRIGGLKVSRRFPDQIFVAGFLREPAAIAALGGRMIVVSRDGFLLSGVSSETKGLPFIKGLKAQKTSFGSPLEDETAGFALALIDGIARAFHVEGMPLRGVNVADAERVVCFFGENKSGFEVYVDKARFAEQLRTLLGIVARTDLDLLEVRYIDLRFGEPLIGKKKARK